MPQQTTFKILQELTGLTKNALSKRLVLMESCGVVIGGHYGKRGIRYFTPDETEKIINWKPKKPGRKRKPAFQGQCLKP